MAALRSRPTNMWLVVLLHRPGYVMRTLVLYLGLVVLPACSLFSAEQPPVDEETLTDVLVEFHMLDARADLGYEIPEHARDSILAHYQLSEERYEEALAYYAQHPDEYLVLYREVLETMNEEDVQMREQREE